MPTLAPTGSDVDAVIFDAYGTLLDVHSAVQREAQQIGAAAVALSELWRTKQLEYAWVLTLAGQYESFWTLTERALDAGLRQRLLKSYERIDPFADATPVVERLNSRGFRIAVLTNANRSMIERAIVNARLPIERSEIISIEDVRRYKTCPESYQLACHRLQLTRDRIAFVSSNAWDVAGATAFGFGCIRVVRASLPVEYEGLAALATVEDLHAIG
jgi:2-haloacid dehalogenase